MKLLFDASSIFNSLVARRPAPMIDQYTLDFTRYELLNVIWKHYTLLHTFNRETFDALLQSSVQILTEMTQLSINGIENKAMETAVTNGISLHDSAYISLAKENQCTLVTEDKKMRKISLELGLPVVSIKDV
ncbi:MAG: type II toxin-antitoxin system VapC family toxin [Candidatus Bathyarchaeota archaeon]|nr:type II toxin-antitoxin system VapC family toxin [Candidatus Bathyarchaeota archaeon]